jgi:hypothetical protein
MQINKKRLYIKVEKDSPRVFGVDELALVQIIITTCLFFWYI